MTSSQVAGMKALSYSDGGAFAPDSYLLVLADGSSLLLTSDTDWTLRIEDGSWPRLPDWAQPPESWRFEDADGPLGTPGFDSVVGVSEIKNEVGEVAGLRVDFDGGAVEFKAGDSVTWRVLR
jgi:hypothetical protein